MGSGGRAAAVAGFTWRLLPLEKRERRGERKAGRGKERSGLGAVGARVCSKPKHGPASFPVHLHATAVTYAESAPEFLCQKLHCLEFFFFWLGNIHKAGKKKKKLLRFPTWENLAKHFWFARWDKRRSFSSWKSWILNQVVQESLGKSVSPFVSKMVVRLWREIVRKNHKSSQSNK